MRLALQEAERGRAEHNEVRSVRAWNLFLLLPRYYLQEDITGAVSSVRAVRVVAMLEAGEEAAESSVRGSRRIRSNLSESVERRAERALMLANLGE